MPESALGSAPSRGRTPTSIRLICRGPPHRSIFSEIFLCNDPYRFSIVVRRSCRYLSITSHFLQSSFSVIS
ncbi:hypothetical protein PHJA_000126100 [Phtheirospermum japonicum]|uniref:Uncharacterized protein n=1 Tax=Phtheirospermum japonicum TaxID=374723 RepID=A0A830AZ46_9LAMI|nr:hypothetical protein PHJA_000126100 [Phtheirospermum japonicum]